MIHFFWALGILCALACGVADKVGYTITATYLKLLTIGLWIYGAGLEISSEVRKLRKP